MSTLLRGSQLDAWLDQIDDAVAQNDAADIAPELKSSMLRDMLAAQVCAPDELGALYRLQRLWCIAGEVQRALALMDEYVPGVLETLEAEERASAEVNTVFWRIEAWCFTGDAEKIAASLTEGTRILLTRPNQGNWLAAWNMLVSTAEQYKLWGLMRQFAQDRLKAEHAAEHRHQWRTFDAAMMQLTLCRSFKGEGLEAEASEAAQVAIDTLSQAGEQEDVGFSDWMNLGHALVWIRPGVIPQILAYARIFMPSDRAPGNQRDAEVQIARLEARMHYHQGELDKAITRAHDGRYSLTGDSDDGFSALLLRWLLEAGREDEAAVLALESADGQRPGSQEEALQLALDRVDVSPNIHWHLILAGAALREEQQWACGDQEPQLFYQHHMAQARAMDASHPTLLTHEIERLLEQEDQPERALPLMEQLVSLQDFPLYHYVLASLLGARAKVHGLDKTLSMPFIRAGAAEWNYNTGCGLDDVFEKFLVEPSDELSARIYDLEGRYYEAGLQRFEAFFASGKGHFRDADIHVYSMLCNNLGIYYRRRVSGSNKAADIENALALHRKGIATSPFAEHHDSIFWCYVDLGDDEKIVEAAEELWHFSSAYGYGRHSPPNYFNKVAASLSRLDRDIEIGIWLERLDNWFASQDVEDQQECEQDYRFCGAYLLLKMCWEQADDVMVRLERDYAEFEKYMDAEPGIANNIGIIYKSNNRLDEAMHHYKRALKSATERGYQDTIDFARANIEEVEAMGMEKTSSEKPWWKFWG